MIIEEILLAHETTTRSIVYGYLNKFIISDQPKTPDNLRMYQFQVGSNILSECAASLMKELTRKEIFPADQETVEVALRINRMANDEWIKGLQRLHLQIIAGRLN